MRISLHLAALLFSALIIFPSVVPARRVRYSHLHRGHHRRDKELRSADMVAKPDFYKEQKMAKSKKPDTVQVAGSSLPDCLHACGSCSPCRLVMDRDLVLTWIQTRVEAVEAWLFSFLILEVKMIRKAHSMGMLTTPYAFNQDEALAMAKAGADIIVAHMGLTTSGTIGANTAITLDDSVVRVQAIADAAIGINPGVIVLCHGGPISGPKEAEFVLKNTRGVHGFYGASSMERLPVEQAITNTVKQYKSISIQ